MKSGGRFIDLINFKKFYIYILVGIIFSLTFVSAGFIYNDNHLVKDYAGGEKIVGEFNISFGDELSDGILSSNFGGNISLFDFLKLNGLNKGVNFNCSTVSCSADFVSVGSASRVNLELGGYKYLGYRLTGGSVEGISEIGINLTSNIGNSCVKQVDLEFIGVGKSLNYVNDNYVNEKCSVEDYGCFDFGLGSYTTAIIGNNILCEKISLPPGPAFMLGAKVENTTNGVVGRLKMKLYNLNGDLLSESYLPEPDKDIGILRTIVNYTNPKPNEYLVCITGDSGAEYKINRETEGTTCGTNNLGSDYNRDYEIFAHPMKYGPVDFEIREKRIDAISGESLLDFAEGYIFDHYSGICNPECIIPIKISGIAQEVNLLSAKLKYTEGGDLVENNNLFSVVKEDSKITSKNLMLNLSLLDIKIPLGNSNGSKFKLYLNGSLIFQEDLNLKESFDFSMEPLFSLVGLDTKFSAITSEKINSSFWKFGDGSSKMGVGKNVTHKYLNSGNYIVEVKLINSGGIESVKVFNVLSGKAKDSVNITLRKYENILGNISSAYDSLDGWIKKDIDKKIKLGDLKANLNILKNKYGSAGNESDYVLIMNELLKFKIPLSISISESGQLPLDGNLDSIDVKYIEELSVGNGSGNTKGNIKTWMVENYNGFVDYKDYGVTYDSGLEDLNSVIKFNLIKKSDYDDGAYFFIDFPIESINFKEDYGQKKIGGGSGVYIPLSGDKIIEFSISEKIKVSDLRAYISPDIKFLPAFVDDKGVRDQKKDEFKFDFWKFGIGGFLLVVLFFVVYLILQGWYRRNYENHLFENKDILYNILSFIYNRRVGGLGDGEIRRKLKKSNWSGEQISYVFKKIDGKRTGMFEIPLFKSSENKKVKREIERRLPEGRNIDTRFIKRPRF